MKRNLVDTKMTITYTEFRLWPRRVSPASVLNSTTTMPTKVLVGATFMRKCLFAILVGLLAVGSVYAQSPPTLRIVTEVPNLPSELFYGDVKVKPLRLRPGTNTPITINDADFYVTQQYVDFLSRFPDQSGFNFWQNEITQCGTNASGIDSKRVHVSGAFFLSIEFQQTGFLVYKMNEAAFGNLPNKPVPVRREDFMPAP